MSDPVKSTTAEALATLRKANIRVVIATGDGLTTARAFGQRLGAQSLQQHRAEHGAAVLMAVALLDAQRHALAIGCR